MDQCADIYLLQRQTLHVSGVTIPRPIPEVADTGWALCRPKHVEFDVAVNKCLHIDASSWSFLLTLRRRTTYICMSRCEGL
jgi:hypothetical protein